jgi:hypothetical protein
VKKTVPTRTKTASVIKKLDLYTERIRVLTSTDLKLVEGGTEPSCETHSCQTKCPIDTCR